MLPAWPFLRVVPHKHTSHAIGFVSLAYFFYSAQLSSSWHMRVGTSHTERVHGETQSLLFIVWIHDFADTCTDMQFRYIHQIGSSMFRSSAMRLAIGHR
jgi:hypothetical protein